MPPTDAETKGASGDLQVVVDSLQSIPKMVRDLSAAMQNQIKTLGERIEEGEARLSDVVAKMDKVPAEPRTVPLTHDDGKTIEHLFMPKVSQQAEMIKQVPGMLRKLRTMDPIEVRSAYPGVADYVEQVHRSGDHLYTLMQILPAINPLAYPHAQAVALHHPIAKGYRALLGMGSSLLAKANEGIATITATKGQEWVPTEYSSYFISRLDLDRKVPGLFKKFPMAEKTVILPVGSTAVSVYNVAEATDANDSNFTASASLTRNVTLAAEQIGGLVWISSEMVEDSIVPILDYTLGELAKAIVTAIEHCILSGDTTSSLDSDMAAGDHLSLWNGLRKVANASAKYDCSTGGIRWDNLLEVRARMNTGASYGVDYGNNSIIFGPKGFLKALNMKDDQNNPAVLTIDKLGPNATIVKGSIGRLGDMDVLISEKLREDLNASGVYDASVVTQGQFLIVHRPSFILGERRVVTLESDKKIENQQIKCVGTWRGDFHQVQVPTTSHNCVGIGYNYTA